MTDELTSRLFSDEVGAENIFTITRTVDAPVDLVWKLHTDAEHLKHWWGPKGFVMNKCTVDLRPGGTFHYGMTGPDGTTMWGKFVYRDIEAPNRMSYVVSFSDENAGITTHPLAPSWPKEVLVMMSFTEKDGKTIVRLVGGPINASTDEQAMYRANHAGMDQGFAGTYDQLDAYVETL